MLHFNINALKEEGILNWSFRMIGFVIIFIVDTLLSYNFFSNLGEGWILSALGISFVFVKIWHFRNAMNTSKPMRKLIHLVGWLAMSFASIIAIISFGLTLTNVPIQDTKFKETLATLNQNSIIADLENLPKEKKTLQELIFNKEKEKTTIPSDWKNTHERINKEIENSNIRIKEIDAILEKYKNSAKEDESKTSTKIINASTIFAQLFTEAGARPAIFIFFLIIGLAIESTLALSILTPENKKKKIEIPVPTDEEVKEIEKQLDIDEAIEEENNIKTSLEDLMVGLSQKEGMYTTITTPIENGLNPLLENGNYKVTLPDGYTVETPVQSIVPEVIKPKRKYTKKNPVTTISKVPKKESEFILDKEVQKAISDNSIELFSAFIDELFNNGGKPELKDLKEVSTLLNINNTTVNKYMQILLNTQGETNFKLIELRANGEEGGDAKYWPNYTSEYIKSFLFKEKTHA